MYVAYSLLTTHLASFLVKGLLFFTTITTITMDNIKIIITKAVIVTAIPGIETELEEDEVSGMGELSIDITGNWNHTLLNNTDDSLVHNFYNN